MTDFPGAALWCTSTNGFSALSHTWRLKKVSLSGGPSHIGHYREYPTPPPHPPWPGLQLKFSFFGSVLFKSNKVVSFKNVILKISKRFPFTSRSEFCSFEVTYVISSFLSGNLHPPPGSETSLSLKKSWVSLLISRHPFHQCQGLFANCVIA